ncbi:zinc finger protein rotund-like isoform x3 protein [Vespula squamosa]|uniref:Zinc finger protein rotund-like isoform x3 protein n=1 Tax=Vespula squamosa TaxID=30214 RepID=A0ABD2C5R7_VESSQ
MYPWYRDSVAAAAAAGLGGPVGVVGSGFCSSGPGQGATTIKTESGYSDCMLALDYVQNKPQENKEKKKMILGHHGQASETK